MKLFYKVFAAVFLLLLVVQCDIANDDTLNDPNEISPENVNPDFLLNNIQLSAEDVFDEASDIGREMTRMDYMFGSTYANAYSAQSFNTMYEDAYAELFVDAESIIPVAEERQLYFHIGIAKALQAYTMLTMVDVFGDIPFDEALDATNFNPGLTGGQAVYDAAITLLDEAIAAFGNQERRALPQNDLFYGDHSDPESAWIKAANTLKLKAFLNTGNADGINGLIADGNLILDAADNFTFEFSLNSVNPDSRHPSFINNYLNGANDYMAINYMNMLLNDKSIADPRMRYYFYRQSTSDATSIQDNPCIGNPVPPSWYNTGDPYCTLGDGWWGRDHLNDEGIPPDNDKRTTFGVYPAGGEFDANQGAPASEDMGLQGAGFRPLLMSSYTYFMLAEAAIELGTTGNAQEYYTNGITASMETVRDYGASLAAGTPFETLIDSNLPTYIADALDNWNSQGNLRANSKEYYLALWPNGLEAYNLLRRTGYPTRSDNMQPTVETANPGEWYRTFSYPSNLVDRNTSVSAKESNHVRTFWDTRGEDDEFDY